MLVCAVLGKSLGYGVVKLVQWCARDELAVL